MSLIERVSTFIETGAAAWVKDLQFELRTVTPGDATFRMPCHAGLVHSGGVVCGQSIMAGMDTGMVYVMASLLEEDEARDFITVQLQTSFERAVPAATDYLDFHAFATKPGRRLVFGQIDCLLPNGQRAATATTQYMWL